MNKVFSSVCIALVAGSLLAACSDDADPATSGSGGGTTSGSGGGATSGSGGAGGGESPALRFLAELDPAAGGFPEGVAVSADGKTAFAGMQFTGSVVAVSLADGKVSEFGSIPAPPMGVGFVLGLAVNDSGDVFVGAASVDPAAYQPGIYRIPSTGGAATLFASSQGLIVPNGLAFNTAGELFVTDTILGKVVKISADGATVTDWISDPLLQSEEGLPCRADLTLPPAGANGIAISGSDVFVANYDRASLVKIPILADGTAGVPEQIAASDDTCSPVKGADGVAADTDGSVLVLGNASNTLVRVGTDGEMTTLVSGDLLDFPASISLATIDGGRYAVISNRGTIPSDANTETHPGLLVYGPLDR